MRLSENTDQLLPALFKVQHAEVKKNKKGHNYTYADLNAVFQSMEEHLESNELAFLQTLDDQVVNEHQVCIITRIYHKSGQWIESRLVVTSKNPDPQGLGSAITYGRRYSLLTMLGLAPEDDDGKTAKVPTTQVKAAQRATQPVSTSKPTPIQAGGEPPSRVALMRKIQEEMKKQGLNYPQVSIKTGIQDVPNQKDPALLEQVLQVLKAG